MTATIVPTRFRVTEYRAFEKNTLRAFISVELPSGIVISNLTYHKKGDSRWVSMPAQSFQKQDHSTGWKPIVDFNSKEARDRFQRAALDAIDSYLAN